MPDRPHSSPCVHHQQDAGIRIHSTIRVEVPARKRKEAVLVLGSIVEQTRHTEGCAGCHLYQGVRKGRGLLLEASWTDEKALYRHLRSEAFRHILLIVEMATEVPEIRFDWVSRYGGIEIVEAARGIRRSLFGKTSMAGAEGEKRPETEP